MLFKEFNKYNIYNKEFTNIILFILFKIKFV